MTPPRMSVVVPAYQEEAVIGSCLDAVHRQVSGDAEVVVVANGCTDRTADVARAHPLRAKVIELPVGSKPAALNAGDAEVTAFPRLYLDADVVLGPGAINALVDALAEGTIHVAAPRPRFQTAARPWLVRSYYATWQRLPFLNEEPVGNGVYALSAAGRARFGSFPPLIADDLYVLRHFTQAERRSLTDAHFVVQTPRHLADLLAVRTRAYLGAAQLAAWDGGRLSSQNGSRVNAVSSLVRSPSDVPAVLAYAAVSVVAWAQATRRWRRRETERWDRDTSTR